MLRTLKHLYKASAVGARPDERKAICAPGVAQFSRGALLSIGIDEDSQIRTAFTIQHVLRGAVSAHTLLPRSAHVTAGLRAAISRSAGSQRLRHVKISSHSGWRRVVTAPRWSHHRSPPVST
jgi:hypothetical protein